MELALPLLLGAISAVLPAFLFSISLFSQELSKLYGESRDVSRAHMSSRGLIATRSKKRIADDLTSVGESCMTACTNDTWQIR